VTDTVTVKHLRTGIEGSMRSSCLCIVFIAVSWSAYAAPVFEGFEGEILGSSAFSAGGYDFSLSGDLRVEGFDQYGSRNSAKWVGTGSFDGGTVGSAGTISLITSNSYFTVTRFDGWTSADDGSTNTSGNVTFMGTEYLTGTVFTDTVYIDPTGYTGADWDEDLTFAGTTLNGINLVSLGADLSGNSLNYLALDHMNLEITAVSPPAPPAPPAVPIPSSIILTISGIGLILAKRHTYT
jgi:hypothetical protein